jgi:hypothetical protein
LKGLSAKSGDTMSATLTEVEAELERDRSIIFSLGTATPCHERQARPSRIRLMSQTMANIFMRNSELNQSDILLLKNLSII